MYFEKIYWKTTNWDEVTFTFYKFHPKANGKK